MLCEMLPHWTGFLLSHFLQCLHQQGAACGRLSVNNARSANAAARIGRCRYTYKTQKSADNIGRPMYRSITSLDSEHSELKCSTPYCHYSVTHTPEAGDFMHMIGAQIMTNKMNH